MFKKKEPPKLKQTNKNTKELQRKVTNCSQKSRKKKGEGFDSISCCVFSQSFRDPVILAKKQKKGLSHSVMDLDETW